MTMRACAVATVPAQALMFLKVDTQGYERAVLEGAGAELNRFPAFSYERELLMHEMIAYMSERGSVLTSPTPGSSDQSTRQFLKIDRLFFGARG